MKVHYITQASQLDYVFRAFTSKGYVGLDTETTGLDPHTSRLRLIQLATDNGIFLIDCFKVKNAYEWVNKLLHAHPYCVYVGHNLKFDMKMLWANGIELTGLKIFDTMLAANIYEGGLPYKFGLKDVAERFLDENVDKTEQLSDWSLPELSSSQLHYAAKDAWMVKELAPILSNYLIEDGLEAVFELEIRALFCLAAMEYFGTRLDLNRLNELRPVYEAKQLRAESDFLLYVPSRFVRYNLFGEIVDKGVEVTSSDQVLKVLRELGIPDPDCLENESDECILDPFIKSTGSNVLKLLDTDEYPILDALFAHRKVSKLLSAYVYSLPELINPKTGRIHPHFNQCVRTGRLSSSNPNAQNMPRPNPDEPLSIRSCFIANQGNVLIDCDYSQIELRVMAEVCGDVGMLEEFLTGKDPYANTAALLSSMTYDEFVTLPKSEYKKRRQNAKAVRLGYNYAMGAKKFKRYAKQTYGVSMTEKEAFENRRLYFDAYPALTEYHKQFFDKSILEVRTLPPFNRRRQWEEYPGVPALANHPIQGTSADITKLAMALIYERLYDKGYSPLQSWDIMPILQVHDEIVLESTIELGEEARLIEQTAMIEAGEVVLHECPVLAEAKIIANLSQKD
jgi:DNA polymerase-1